MTQKMNKFNSLKKTTKVDFATYFGVIAAFVIVTVLQSNGSLKRSAIGLLVPICCYMSMAVSLNLTRSRAGRAIMAIRDNRIAAQAIGLNLTKYKLMAFVTSAALAGAAGALYGLNYSSLQATKFNFNLSILVLVFVVLGGLGNIWGSLIAAAALTILPEALRQFADFRMLIYAIVLIFVMLATNNPQAKAFFQKLLPHRRASAEKED